MITVKPFNAVRYNEKNIANLSDVLTPPYDIIDPKMQEDLYKTHPKNFVRIDFGKKYPEDNNENNVYQRAKNTFVDWQNDGSFIQDENECFYILEQKFSIKDGENTKELSRLGFYGLFKLQNFSKDGIMPHEKTQSGPKEDRYLLTKKCMAYFSGVFSIYEDNDMTIENLFKSGTFGNPIFSYTDYQGVINKLYLSNNPQINIKISEMMKNKRLFIADGHHRYEMSLRIKNELSKNDDDKFNYTLMYFSNTKEDGLVVLPTHRVLTNAPYNEAELKAFLNGKFNIIEKSHSDVNEALDYMKKNAGKHVFTLALKKSLLVLELKNNESINSFFPENFNSVLKELDVNILFYVILKGFFGLTEQDIKNQNKISYEKDAEKAVEKVCSDIYDIAFILNPTDISYLEKTADIGETMPQKSTYFYPKIPSGAVIYKLE